MKGTSTLYAGLFALGVIGPGCTPLLTAQGKMGLTTASVENLLNQNYQIHSPSHPQVEGHQNYCKARVDDITCRNQYKLPNAVISYQELYNTIFSGNLLINAAIEAKEDIELYGQKEKWTSLYSKMGKQEKLQGDCEDYVLTKFHYFFYEKNIPDSAMRVAVVKDEKGEGHAVLLILSDKGVLMLDSKQDSIIVFSTLEDFDTNPLGYTFVSMMGNDSPTKWISLEKSWQRMIVSGN